MAILGIRRRLGIAVALLGAPVAGCAWAVLRIGHLDASLDPSTVALLAGQAGHFPTLGEVCADPVMSWSVPDVCDARRRVAAFGQGSAAFAAIALDLLLAIHVAARFAARRCAPLPASIGAVRRLMAVAARAHGAVIFYVLPGRVRPDHCLARHRAARVAFEPKDKRRLMEQGRAVG